jgi:hypothetical protein
MIVSVNVIIYRLTLGRIKYIQKKDLIALISSAKSN